MDALEATHADRPSVEVTGAAIQPVSRQEAIALLTLPIALLGVVLVLALTLGVTPPG